MTIGDSINRFNRKYSPYMGNLVNHLPMGQLALYKMTRNVASADEYARYFTERFAIDPVETNSKPATSLDECIGNRSSYAACLPVISEIIEKQGVDTAVASVLNQYLTGMSSGLFHVLIRLAYAVEGAEIEEQLKEEVTRALSYYATGYRGAGLLTRNISPKDIVYEMQKLSTDPEVQHLLSQQPSMGKKMKALYDSDLYQDRGFILHGTEKDKVEGLLSFFVPAFLQSNNIVVLHCITGLHALMNLKKYFNDFDHAVDVYTTCCLTHLLTVDGLTFIESSNDHVESIVEISWNELFSQGSQSKDVHTIKFTYTCHQLELLHGFDQSGLKKAALYRISKT